MDTNTHTVHQQRVNAFLSFLFFWSALVFVVATRLSLAAAHMGFSHCEAWAPEYVGSIVVCRLLQLGLWHVGSQFPDQGSKLCPLHWEGRFLTTGPQGMLLCSEVFEYNMTNLWLNTELCRYSGDHQKYKLKKKKKHISDQHFGESGSASFSRQVGQSQPSPGKIRIQRHYLQDII